MKIKHIITIRSSKQLSNTLDRYVLTQLSPKYLHDLLGHFIECSDSYDIVTTDESTHSAVTQWLSSYNIPYVMLRITSEQIFVNQGSNNE